MPSGSLRMIRHNLPCVFRLTTPYTTWMPADSIRVAHAMLLRSSKRAFSSTSTATCLPCSAAVTSMSTTGEFAPMRYRVILIAMTCGSSMAARRNASTDENESNG